jgi:hypothetical protein
VKNNPFLKVFEVLRNFSQKVSKWGAGAKPRRISPADKLQFPAQAE